MEGSGEGALNAEGTWNKGSTCPSAHAPPLGLEPHGGQGGLFLAISPPSLPTNVD